MVKKCVFIDRDGVLNRSNVINGKPYAPNNISNFIFLPRVNQAINILKKKKYLIIIITNQPDISNGKLKTNQLVKMNDKIYKYLKVDDIFVCTHSREENCNCRKPKIGLFKKAIKKYSIDTSLSYMVGDRKMDIEAGNKINLKTIFIDKNYTEQRPINFDYKCKSLYSSLKYIN